MENKQQLIDSIKDWVKLDNEIRKLQSEITSRKNEKKNVSTKLMQTMNANNIDCFDIKDGQLCYNKRSVKKPITKKMLMETLSNYFDGDLLKASELNNYIIDNRVEEVKESITRKINK